MHKSQRNNFIKCSSQILWAWTRSIFKSDLVDKFKHHNVRVSLSKSRLFLHLLFILTRCGLLATLQSLPPSSGSLCFIGFSYKEAPEGEKVKEKCSQDVYSTSSPTTEPTTEATALQDRPILSLFYLGLKTPPSPCAFNSMLVSNTTQFSVNSFMLNKILCWCLITKQIEPCFLWLGRAMEGQLCTCFPKLEAVPWAPPYSCHFFKEHRLLISTIKYFLVLFYNSSVFNYTWITTKIINTIIAVTY